MSEKTKSVEVSQSALMFFGILLMAAIGFGGYLYGKVNTMEKGGTPTNGQQPAQQQQQQAQQPQQPTVTMDQIKELFDDKNIAFGKSNSKVLFVEFSDPSCPFCHVAAGKNGALNKQMGDRFTLVKDGGSYVAPVEEMKKLVDAGKAGYVWMYANGHGNGELATKAMYCAKEQNKFWEVHDQLMTEAGYNLINNDVKNDKTKIETLTNFLKSAADAGKLKSCLESGKYDNRIAEDQATATKLGFQGTPNFFVNTQNFAGAYSYTDIKATVDAALK